jgi:hypothetical protein
VSLVLTVLISVAADFSATHLFNPEWPPHAKFHDAAMLHLLTGSAVMALWLLWRKTLEPQTAALVGWLVPVMFWSPFFWVSVVLPQTSLHAMPGQPSPLHLGGVEVLPNIVAAFALITVSTIGLSRHRRAFQQRFAAPHHL